MSATIHRHITTALLLVAAVVVTGCVQQNPTAIQFVGNAAVLRQPGGGGGTQPGTCIKDQTQFYRSFGTIDLMIATQYDLFPEIENRLERSVNVSGNLPSHLRADASYITVEGAEITIRLRQDKEGPYDKSSDLPASNGWVRQQAATDALAPTSFYFTKTWFSPMARSIPSLERVLARFQLIPPDVGQDLRRAWSNENEQYEDRYTTVVPAMLDFQIEARMADGTVIRTQIVRYPMNLCWGCLLFLPGTSPGVDDVDPVNMFRQCSNKVLTVEQFTPPCIPGNDEAMPCGFYCHVCQGNETLTTPFATEYACDTRFCPKS